MRRSTPGSTLVVLNWRDRRHRSAGGAELYCERLARELAARGASVVLVTSRPADTPAREVVDGYTIRRLGRWWSVYPLALLWLLRHRSSVGAVVDSQNGIPFFSPLVTRRHTPVVLLVHHVHQDLFTRALRPLAARLARWLEGPASRRVYRRRPVVVLSPSGRTQVRRRLRFDGPVRVVPCGADTLGVRGERSAAPRIVVVGRLTPYKRLDSLVDAMVDVQARLPDAELHLIGDGPARRELVARARETGARVVFHGRLSDARRDTLLSTAWLAVSASDGGDWAVSLVEANAAGVPVLARRVSGLRDTVRHGQTGWLVDGEPSVLAEAITRALVTLTDPAVARTFGQRARAWAARFTWARTADGVLQALDTERARLERRRSGDRERRSGNDLVVVLSVQQSALPEGWESSRRSGDVWVSDGDTVRALLTGADEGDVEGILVRLGIHRDDPSVSVLVARHADLLDDRHPVAVARQDARGGGHAA
ncbi:glycosyltransferase family 4 protein [Geodermatophilus sp. DSM 44513]|uniref:glycosyltransferase family 4 protein n=1 Tax=Geodermatophilus sp. DSM 44513 TaxID=1528104 RepID=UPI00127EDF05|nr:glycosyltransferase family 4 protein [Geodermatophilus sp. DSM 44513]WNV75877.1 glycosyltransferase family 4 protein [Geodermatophilus sp. DSM 44513]